MGVSVVEGTVTVWHKRVGDWVSADETICEISTDKIDTDVPAPVSGRVAELVVAEGETVAVGTVLARIATDATPGQAHPDEEDPGSRGGGGHLRRDAAARTGRRGPGRDGRVAPLLARRAADRRRARHRPRARAGQRARRARAQAGRAGLPGADR